MMPTPQRGLIGLEVRIVGEGPENRVVYVPTEELAEAELTMARLRSYSNEARREALSKARATADETGA